MSAKRTTILQIIPELDTGGAEISTIEIAGGIVAAGGRAIVLSEGGRLAPRLAEVGAELMLFPAATKNPVKLFANARSIARLVNSEGVHLLHARSRAPAWSALLASRRAGVPFVATYHGAYAETNALKRAYNSVMVRGDAVIANSEYTGRLIRERYGVGGDRLIVIHRGVDPSRFDPAKITPERIAALRARFDVEADQPVIVNAARLTGWKGQSVLIAAAGELLKSGRLGRAVIVLAGDAQGRDGYRERLETDIAALGLREHVRLAGHVEDIPAAFALAHLCVIASTEAEAFGRTATEAQAMGVPVIATAIGAPPETVLAGAPDMRTGWHVPPGDAPALAAAIGEALALSSEARRAMGARGIARVRAHFTLDRMRLDTL
ncbi:MAG TPA: glycosyltransferase family 4 protein, partial [Hyphomicrobiaceae bacterium]|nr:glycosyltransferase family 4 protein [Hyphomicrobiaceae bacterium]